MGSPRSGGGAPAAAPIGSPPGGRGRDRPAEATGAATELGHSLLGLSHLNKSPNWSFAGKPPPEADQAIPGPGTYAVRDADCTSRFGRGPHFTFGGLGREVVSKHKMPGPGSYTLSRDFGKGGLAYSVSPRRTPRPAAGTAAAKVESRDKELPGPGPGAHSISSRFGEGPKYSVASGRADLNHGILPGPGDYDIALSEATSERQPRCCFATAASTTPANGTGNTPGPGTYSWPAAVGEGPKFSMKARLAAQKPQETPGPGAHGGQWSTLGDHRPAAVRVAPLASPRRGSAAGPGGRRAAGAAVGESGG